MEDTSEAANFSVVGCKNKQKSLHLLQSCMKSSSMCSKKGFLDHESTMVEFPVFPPFLKKINVN